MGNEGWEVARALNERGVAAFVLKYRLMPTAPDWAEFNKGNPLTAPTPGAAAGAAPALPPVTLPLEDAPRPSSSCARGPRNGTSIPSVSA
jgi:hypothetical protein